MYNYNDTFSPDNDTFKPNEKQIHRLLEEIPLPEDPVQFLPKQRQQPQQFFNQYRRDSIKNNNSSASSSYKQQMMMDEDRKQQLYSKYQQEPHYHHQQYGNNSSSSNSYPLQYQFNGAISSTSSSAAGGAGGGVGNNHNNSMHSPDRTAQLGMMNSQHCQEMQGGHEGYDTIGSNIAFNNQNIFAKRKNQKNLRLQQQQEEKEEEEDFQQDEAAYGPVPNFRPGQFQNINTNHHLLSSKISTRTGGEDSDYSGSLTPAQMQKWSRRHIGQGESLFPKVQAPSVEMTMNQARNTLNASSNSSMSPLSTMRNGAFNFGVSKEKKEAQMQFVGALRDAAENQYLLEGDQFNIRDQNSVEEEEINPQTDSPLTISPSSYTSKWILSPNIAGARSNRFQNAKQPSSIPTDRIITPSAHQLKEQYNLAKIDEKSQSHAQSRMQPQQQQQDSSIDQRNLAPQYMPLSTKNSNNFQSCDTLGAVPSFGEEAIPHSSFVSNQPWNNNNNNINNNFNQQQQKQRPGSAASQASSVNSYPRLNFSQAGYLRASYQSSQVPQQTKSMNENEVREFCQGLRFKLSQALISNENALMQKAVFEKKYQENNAEVTLLKKKVSDQENKIEDLGEHIALLNQKFGKSSKLPVLRGQALQNAKIQLKQLRGYLLDKDGRIKQLQEENINLKNMSMEKTPYENEVERLNVQSSKKDILLISLKKQVKDLKSSSSLANKAGQDQIGSLTKQLNKVQQTKIEFSRLLDQADQEIRKKNAQIDMLRAKCEQSSQLQNKLRDVQHKALNQRKEYQNRIKQLEEQLLTYNSNGGFRKAKNIAQSQARNFDMHTINMRDQYEQKFNKLQQETVRSKQQKDKLQKELQKSRQKCEAMSQQLTQMMLGDNDDDDDNDDQLDNNKNSAKKIKQQQMAELTQFVSAFDQVIQMIAQDQNLTPCVTIDKRLIDDKNRRDILLKIYEAITQAAQYKLEQQSIMLQNRSQRNIQSTQDKKNQNSSDFSHQLLLERDKEIELLKSQLNELRRAEKSQLPKYQEILREKEELVEINQNLERRMNQMSLASLGQLTQTVKSQQQQNILTITQMQSHQPQMRGLVSLTNLVKNIAGLVNYQMTILQSFSKQASNRLELQSLQGSSLRKSSRQMHFTTNGESQQSLSNKMIKEIGNILTLAQNELKSKSAQASEAKRLLKQERQKNQQVYSPNKKADLLQELKTSLQQVNRQLEQCRNERQMWRLQAEKQKQLVKQAQKVMKYSSSARSIGKQSPFSTPKLSSRAQKEQQRLQDVLFGNASKMSETMKQTLQINNLKSSQRATQSKKQKQSTQDLDQGNELVPDQFIINQEQEAKSPTQQLSTSGTLIPLKTPRNNRSMSDMNQGSNNKSLQKSISKSQRQQSNKDCDSSIQTLDRILKQLLEDNYESQEQKSEGAILREEQIYKRLQSFKSHIEFRITQVIQNAERQLFPQLNIPQNEILIESRNLKKKITPQTAVGDLQSTVLAFKKHIQAQADERELKTKTECLQQLQTLIQKLFKLQYPTPISTTNMATILERLKAQVSSNARKQVDQCQEQAIQNIERMRLEFDEKINQKAFEIEQLQIKLKQSVHETTVKHDQEVKQLRALLIQEKEQSLKNQKQEIDQLIGLKQQQMAAKYSAEMNKQLIQRQKEMGEEFKKFQIKFNAQREEKFKGIQQDHNQRVNRLEKKLLQSQESMRNKLIQERQSMQKKFNQRKKIIESTYQSKIQSIANEKESLQEQLKFLMGQKNQNEIADIQFKKAQIQKARKESQKRADFYEKRLKIAQKQITKLKQQQNSQSLNSQHSSKGGKILGPLSARRGSCSPHRNILPKSSQQQSHFKSCSNNEEDIDLKLQLIEVKQQFEKEKKKLKDDIRNNNDRHRAELKRVRIECQNQCKKIEAECGRREKKVRQQYAELTRQVDQKSVDLQLKFDRQNAVWKKQKQSKEEKLRRAEIQMKEKIAKLQMEREMEKEEAENRQQIIESQKQQMLEKMHKQSESQLQEEWQRRKGQLQQAFQFKQQEQALEFNQERQKLNNQNIRLLQIIKKFGKKPHSSRSFDFSKSQDIKNSYKKTTQLQEEEEYKIQDDVVSTTFAPSGKPDDDDDDEISKQITPTSIKDANAQQFTPPPLPSSVNLIAPYNQGGSSHQHQSLLEVQSRMNNMVKDMQQAFQIQCQKNKEKEQERCLAKMKKARGLLVQDAIQKISQVVLLIIQKILNQMKPNDGYQIQNKQIMLNEQVAKILSTMGLISNETQEDSEIQQTVAQRAVKQIQNGITQMLISAKQILKFQFNIEKDKLIAEIVNLQSQLSANIHAKGQEQVRKSQQSSAKNNFIYVDAKEGMGNSKHQHNLQKQQDNKQQYAQDIFDQNNPYIFNSQVNLPKQIQHYIHHPQKQQTTYKRNDNKQYLIKLIKDLFLLADTQVQILADNGNPASLRFVGVWLKKQLRKIKLKKMDAMNCYRNMFNLLSKTMLQVKRSISAGDGKGPRREQIVKLKLENAQLGQKLDILRKELKNLQKKQQRDDDSVFEIENKFEESMADSSVFGQSVVGRVLQNPELLSPEETVSFLINILSQAKGDASLHKLLKESPEFNLFLQQNRKLGQFDQDFCDSYDNQRGDNSIVKVKFDV